jgi:hypothetical protein
MNTTGREIIDVLERVVDLEWFRYTRTEGVGPTPVSVPITVWRFNSTDVGAEKVDHVVRTVRSVLASFSGNVRWSFDRSGRNWVLQPTPVQELEDAGTFRTHGDLLDSLRSQDPKLGPRAHEDLRAIAGELAHQLQVRELGPGG